MRGQGPYGVQATEDGMVAGLRQLQGRPTPASSEDEAIPAGQPPEVVVVTTTSDDIPGDDGLRHFEGHQGAHDCVSVG